MPEREGSAFALAAALRALNDQELAVVIRDRQFRATGVVDFFVLAERLLDSTTLQAALSELDRRTLLTLAVVCEQSASSPATLEDIRTRLGDLDRPGAASFPSTLESRLDDLVAKALVIRAHGRFIGLDAVRDLLATWPTLGLPDLMELAAPVPRYDADADLPDPSVVEAVSVEHAITTPTAIADLIDELAHDSARELARGGVSAPDLKRLGAAALVEPETVPQLLSIARRSGLIAFGHDGWRPSPDASAWEVLPLADRWARLADGWLNRIRPDIRHVLSDQAHVVWGRHNQEYLAWMFPAAGERAITAQNALLSEGELLGLLHQRMPSTIGAALIARGTEAALDTIRPLLPAPESSVYVQNDLSIIATGPLEPAIDARLRTIADAENRAVASTFRVSQHSLDRALRSGESEQSILEFLGSIARGPLPQPLRYLVSEVAGRFGVMRVGTVRDDPSVSRVSYLRSTDTVLVEAALVDRRLAPLGLTSDGPGRVTSRFPRDALYRALVDAHYPATAEDADEKVEGVQRHHLGRQTAPHPPAPWERHDVAQLIATLRTSETSTDETGWIERQLELAVRSKLRVSVVVRMPSGETEKFVLEPTGVANGRVRARDRKADIERTLPLSRIVEVTGASER